MEFKDMEDVEDMEDMENMDCERKPSHCRCESCKLVAAFVIFHIESCQAAKQHAAKTPRAYGLRRRLFSSFFHLE